MRHIRYFHIHFYAVTVLSFLIASIFNTKVLSAQEENAALEPLLYAQYAGGRIDLTGTDGAVTGDISAGSTIQSGTGMAINGNLARNADTRGLEFDMDAYAQSADHQVAGNKTFTGGDPYTGKWFVNGRVIIQDNAVVNGTIVATGRIDMSNAVNIKIAAASSQPALVSGGKIVGNNTVGIRLDGLVFAGGSIAVNNSADVAINGLIVAGGNIEIKNSKRLNLTYNGSIKNNPPPYLTYESAVLDKDDE